MADYYVIYDVASGDERWRTDAEVENLEAGLASALVPRAAVAGGQLDLGMVKAFYSALVDAAAGQVRAQFVTVTPGQTETYRYKANEARAWKADHSASVPFLTKEAAAVGQTVAALADEVLAAEAAWISIGSSIEAARRGANVAIAAASNIGGIVAARAVDWTAVLTPAP